MNEEKDKTGLALTGAVIAAVTASLCCILPIVAAVVGLTGFAASEFFARWRPYLLAVTFVLLGGGFYLAYRPRQEACEAGSVCQRTPLGRWNRAILWAITALVLVLAAFPYYSGWVARAVTKRSPTVPIVAQNAAAHLVLRIEGMDCPGCAALIEKKLSQISGVRRAEASFERKQASVDYDPCQVDPSRFVNSITNAGYRVANPPPARN